jgi:hypothetical protein
MPWRPATDDELQQAQTEGWLPGSGGAPAGGGMTSGLQGMQALAQQLNPAGQLRGQPLLDYMEKNDPEGAEFVKALKEGRATGSGRNLQKMIPIATAIYGSDFDQGAYAGRLQTRKSFMSGGKDWQNLQSYGQTIGHATELLDSIGDLGNVSFAPGVVNAGTHWLKRNLGNEKFQAAENRFNSAKGAVSEELARAFRATGMAESDVKGWKDQLDENASPAALRSTVQEAMKLLESRMETTTAGWNQSFPDQPRTVQDNLKLVAPHAAGRFEDIQAMDPTTGQMPPRQQGAQGAPGPPGPQGAAMPQNAPAPAAMAPGGIREGQTATNRQTGQRIIFRNGAWGPM